jgi:hypothetical protein
VAERCVNGHVMEPGDRRPTYLAGIAHCNNRQHDLGSCSSQQPDKKGKR